MKHKRSSISFNIVNIFIILFAFQFSLSAQSKVYTLDEAINTAISNNRDITISVMNVKKSGAAVDEAFGYALPSLNLSGNFSHFLQKPKMSFPDFGALLQNATYSILFDENVIPRDESKFKPMQNVLQSFAQTNNFSTDITLTQTLFSSAVFKGIGASKIYYNLAKADLNSTVSKMLKCFTHHFYPKISALWPTKRLTQKRIIRKTNATFCHKLMCDNEIQKSRLEYIQLSLCSLKYVRYWRSLTTWKTIILNLLPHKAS